MKNWKSELESFSRVNGCIFAMSIDQVEKFVEPLVKDMVGEIKKRQEEVKIERLKTAKAMELVDSVVIENAILKQALDKIKGELIASQLKLAMPEV